MSTSAGARSLQTGMANGQRGWKWQPEGGETADGGSPARTIRCRFRWRLGLATGTAESRAAVYGCWGAVDTAAAGPVSTMRPRYITATRALIERTTYRSCEMNR